MNIDRPQDDAAPDAGDDRDDIEGAGPGEAASSEQTTGASEHDQAEGDADDGAGG